jgi:hypothetical protein
MNWINAVATFTRPADTTAYTAKDAVTNSTSAPAVLTFAGAGAGMQRRAFLRGAKLMVDNPTITNGSFRLHLYRTAPTPINDNAAFTQPFSDAANYLGFVDFTLKFEGGTLAYDVVGNLGLPILANGDDLFGVLEATGAYVPTSAENFRVELLLTEY